MDALEETKDNNNNNKNVVASLKILTDVLQQYQTQHLHSLFQIQDKKLVALYRAVRMYMLDLLIEWAAKAENCRDLVNMLKANHPSALVTDKPDDISNRILKDLPITDASLKIIQDSISEFTTYATQPVGVPMSVQVKSMVKSSIVMLLVAFIARQQNCSVEYDITFIRDEQHIGLLNPNNKEKPAISLPTPITSQNLELLVSDISNLTTVLLWRKNIKDDT